MSSPNDQEKGLAGTPGKIKRKISDVIEIIKKNGRDDPRRITHSIKLGFALTLVSLFYYFRPLYDGLGQAGMWAILTVVVVFEFTVGGTLYKGLNRGFATFLAGSLGVGAEYLAGQCGETGEPIVLGLLVFLLATVSTFTRFIPSVKRRCDYGVVIFILTFSLVAVSGFRVDQILQMAHQRLSTIMLGGATCVLISAFVCPVWAGQDLHNLISGNLEKLADFLQGFGGEFFSNISGGGDQSDDDKGKSFLKGYKSVLASKQNEESLANFAWWEPAHGHFRFYHPWKLYLNIGNISRECACLVEILVKCIEDSKPQAESELQQKLQPLCMKLSTQLGKTLKELSGSIKNMTFPSPLSEKHFQDSKSSADKLGKLLESSSLPTEANLHEIAPLLTVASVLIDIIECVEKIKASVQELSENARFKNVKANNTSESKQNPLLHRGAVIPVDDASDGNNIRDHVIIEIQPTSQDALERKQVKA